MTILPTTLYIHSRQMAKQSNYRWKYFSGSGHQTPFKICVVCTIATKISVLLCYLKQKSCSSVCLSVYRIFAGYLESVCVGRNLFWGKHNFSIWFFDVTYTSHTSVSPSASLGLPWGLSIRCHPPVVIVVVQDLMLIRVFLARLTISLIIIFSLTFV